MRRLAVSCAWEYPPEVFCIHKPCKAQCFHYGHGVNSWGSCLATSVASQRVWKNRKHCWRPDMPLPYSHEADWKHQHQEQANKCRSHCLYLLESQTEECSGWPWTVALSVAHSCALGCTPSMSADPPRHQGKVRFLGRYVCRSLWSTAQQGHEMLLIPVAWIAERNNGYLTSLGSDSRLISGWCQSGHGTRWNESYPRKQFVQALSHAKFL